MNIRNEIIDYEKNKDEIEKWLYVKGEDKYCRFLFQLKKAGFEPTWKNISDLYRYDKRLLVTCFVYFAFFEEYVRAILVRENPKKTSYEQVKEDCFGHLKANLLTLDSEIIERYFQTDNIEAKLQSVRLLRNNIAHSKIIIQSDYKMFISDFHDLLPKDYQGVFINHILSCEKDLIVPEQLRIDAGIFKT